MKKALCALMLFSVFAALPTHAGIKKDSDAIQSCSEEIDQSLDFTAMLDGEANRAAFNASFGKLREIYQKILSQHYGLNGEEARSLAAIGREMGFSRQRAAHLKHKAIRRLKQILENQNHDW